MPPTYETLADLLRPQGRRGELLAEPHTSDLSRLAAGCTAFVVSQPSAAPAAGADRTAIEAAWEPTGRNAGRIVLKLAGCDTISAAEALAGSKLLVPHSERPAIAEADTFYVSDLIGCTLFDGAEPIGQVIDIEYAATPDGRTRLEDAAPLLVVQPPNLPDETYLVPFIRAQIEQVDTANKRIIMHLPDGLLDLT